MVLSALVEKIRLLRIRTKARVTELYTTFSVNTSYYIYEILTEDLSRGELLRRVEVRVVERVRWALL